MSLNLSVSRMWNSLSGPSCAPVAEIAVNVFASRARRPWLPLKRRQPVTFDSPNTGASSIA